MLDLSHYEKTPNLSYEEPEFKALSLGKFFFAL